MGIIHIVYNNQLRTHIFYNGPLNDPSKIPDDLKRKEYSSLDGLLNCFVKDFKIDIHGKIKVKLVGYTPEDKAFIDDKLKLNLRHFKYYDG